MNTGLRTAFEIAAVLSGGSLCSKNDLVPVRKRLGRAVPEWYRDALSEFPIAGGYLRYEIRGQKHDLELLRPDGILDEAFAAQPGRFVRESGLIPIAGCATGSGDPYFVRFNCDDPQVLQICHDAAGPEGIAPGGFCVVADSLTSLLLNVRAWE